MGRIKKVTQPKTKFHPHEKRVTLRIDLGKDFLREKPAAEIVAQIAKRTIEEFKAREGLDANGNDEGNKASD
jgi:hypothetical protein